MCVQKKVGAVSEAVRKWVEDARQQTWRAAAESQQKDSSSPEPIITFAHTPKEIR